MRQRPCTVTACLANDPITIGTEHRAMHYTVPKSKYNYHFLIINYQSTGPWLFMWRHMQGARRDITGHQQVAPNERRHIKSNNMGKRLDASYEYVAATGVAPAYAGTQQTTQDRTNYIRPAT